MNHDAIFKNTSMQSCIAELYQILEDRQNKTSRDTCFGHGFERWVLSLHLLQHLNSSPQRQYQFTFKEVRQMYKELARRNLIAIKQSRSNGMLQYSTLRWGGCKNIGDYFIEYEDINPNSIEGQGRQPY